MRGRHAVVRAGLVRLIDHPRGSGKTRDIAMMAHACLRILAFVYFDFPGRHGRHKTPVHGYHIHGVHASDASPDWRLRCVYGISMRS